MAFLPPSKIGFLKIKKDAISAVTIFQWVESNPSFGKNSLTKNLNSMLKTYKSIPILVTGF